MKIIEVNDNIIQELRKSGLSREMKSLESCKWVVLEEQDGKIIGAVGLGGLFHVSGIQINKDYRGKGIGKRIQGAMIEEAKRRGNSFVTVFIDPRNPATVKLHDSLGYTTIFRIHYSPKIVQDVKILVFKRRGKIVKKLLTIFNTMPGTIMLAFILKVTKLLFPKIFIYSEEIPEPDIKWIIKNFEKVKN